jgi:hypothetical protein
MGLSSKLGVDIAELRPDTAYLKIPKKFRPAATRLLSKNLIFHYTK